jgi:glutaryl-CoA transferase
MDSPAVGATEVVASAISISGIPKDIRTPTPEAGASTEDVLRSVGYDADQIAAMRAQGVI